MILSTKILLMLIVLTGCSIDKMVIGFAQPIIDGGIIALFQEPAAVFLNRRLRPTW